MPTRTVTKHDFLTALGCETRAWFGMRESGGAPPPADLLRMQEGQDVHRRAQRLHPDGARQVRWRSDVDADVFLERVLTAAEEAAPAPGAEAD